MRWWQWLVVLLILAVAVGIPILTAFFPSGPDGDTLFKRNCLAHHGVYYASEDAGHSFCRYGGKP